MTVLNENNRSDHIISIAAVDYSYDFKIFDEADLVVKSRSSAGVETTLVLNSDYSVHGVGDSNGGYITPSVAYKTAHDGEALAIIRRVSVKQGTSIRNQGKFFPETLEDVFDYITMICQQISESIGRTIILPDTASSEDFDPSLPAPVALALIGWDSSGKKIQNFSGVSSALVSSAMSSVVAASTLSLARSAMGVAAIDSPTLTGSPNAPTPAQFNNTTQLATTAFVKQALGSLSGQVAYTGAATMAQTDIGKLVELSSSSSFTLTLPSTSGVPAGAALTFANVSSGAVTLSGSMFINGTGSVSTYAMPQGATSQFVWDGSNWALVNGNGMASLNTSGYIRFPGGLIIQWGSSAVTAGTLLTVTLPITFPNSIFTAYSSINQTNATANVYSNASPYSASQIKLSVSSGTINTQWFAIGY